VAIRPIQQHKCSNIDLCLIYGTCFGHQFYLLYLCNIAWWWPKHVTYVTTKWISEYLCSNIGLITIEYINLIKYNGVTLLRLIRNPVHWYQLIRRHMPERCNVYRHRYYNLISHKTIQGGNKAIMFKKQYVCSEFVFCLTIDSTHLIQAISVVVYALRMNLKAYYVL
jgi:hypothetical protein